MIRVGVLGPVSLEVDGEQVKVAGTIRRALLARLALAHGDAVTVDRLIEDLWSGAPPKTAVGTIQTYVSQLRRHLGDALVTRASGYALELPDEAVDARRFEAALRAGQPEDSLCEWRGSPLAELAELDWAVAEARRLEELRLQALEGALRRRVERNDPSVVADLERLVDEHPLREAAWELLVTTLYRAGRQTEALRTYQRLRDTLAQQVGVEPSPRLQAVERAILEHRLDDSKATDRDLASLRLEFPAGLAVTDDPPLCGRAAALRALLDGDEHRIAIVSGEPGIGKTRLTAEVARRRHDAGAIVLHGQCDPGAVVPLQPFLQALTALVRALPEAVLQAHVDEHGPALAHVLPVVGRRLQIPSADASPSTGGPLRWETFTAVSDLLASVSATRPVLLVVDDLHWAGEASLALLLHLVRSEGGSDVRVAATCRDAELPHSGARGELLHRLRTSRRFLEVTLEGLDAEEVADYLAHHDRLGVGVASAIESTGGNPFLLGQLVAHLGESGGNTSDLDAVARRLAGSSTSAIELLRHAAVLGHEVDLAVLERIADDPEEIVSGLDEALLRRLLVTTDTPGRYRFVHALVRDAAYAQLSEPRRLRLHRRAAEALEQGGADPGVIAHHHDRGARAGDAAEAARWVLEAARQATHGHAWYEAADLAHRGRELLALDGRPDPTREAELMIAEAWALQFPGDPQAGEVWLAAADVVRRSADARLMALLGAHVVIDDVGRRNAEREAILEECHDRLGEVDDDLRCALTIAFVRYHMIAGDRRRGARLAPELLDGLVEHPHPDVRLEAAAAINHAHLLTGRYRRALAEAPRVAALLSGAEHPHAFLRSRQQQLVGLCHLALGDLRSAFPELREAADLMGRVRPGNKIRDHHQLDSVEALLAGRFDEAESAANAVARQDDPGDDGGFIWAQQLFHVRYEQGRLSELTDAVAAFAERNPAIRSLSLVEAVCRLDAGDGDAATRLLESAASEGWDRGGEDDAALALFLGTQLVGRLGRADLATPLLEALDGWGGDLLILGHMVFASRQQARGVLLSELGRADEALGAFEAALCLEEQMGAEPFVTRTRAWLARCLLGSRARGDRERGRSAAERAFNDAERMGMLEVAAMAGELLAS